MFKLLVFTFALIWSVSANHTAYKNKPLYCINTNSSMSIIKNSNINCTVTSYDEIRKAVVNCTELVIDGITVPGGKTLTLDLKNGTRVTFKGNITFGYSEWVGPLVQVKGSNVTVKGAYGSKLFGLGAKYWDGKGDGGIKKPKFFKIITTDGSLLENIHLVDCPHQCVSANAHHTVLNNWRIDITSNKSDLASNTDGFDVSGSSFLTIQNSLVNNKDDCVAVNQGTDLMFKNLTCIGGHGLSLSVGQSSEDGIKNTVSNVTFANSSIINSRNGIHIKTHIDGGDGLISKVSYTNIKLSGIKRYGINIEQNYQNGRPRGNATNNIPIIQFVLQNVTGTMNGDSSRMPIYVLCGTEGCSNWNWCGIAITNGTVKNNYNFTPSKEDC